MFRNDILVELVEKNKWADFILHYKKVEDINAQNFEGITPLIATIIYDRSSLFSLLLQHENIDLNAPDSKGFTPLYHAMRIKKFSYKVFLQGRGAQ